MNIALLLVCFQLAWSGDESAWSKEVLVRNGIEPVVRFQARIEGDYLVIKATHLDGWHTYAMDNELRATAALNGKASLGIEQGLSIKVESGLELDDRWLQSEPEDLSKPELRWFTYGFGQTALFACRVKKVSADQVMLRVKGQACSGETCCQVDVRLLCHAIKHTVDEQAPSRPEQFEALLKRLVPVQSRANESNTREPKQKLFGVAL